jgi:hypothetical protein
MQVEGVMLNTISRRKASGFDKCVYRQEPRLLTTGAASTVVESSHASLKNVQRCHKNV